MRIYVSAIGQDSHRFSDAVKPLMLGGVKIEGTPGLEGNSDADVILHAVTNALSGLSGRPVLGKRADERCAAGETDSRVYLNLALKDLKEDPRDWRLHHLSISVEGARPKLMPLRETICSSVALLLGLQKEQVCMTATTGEALTAFGRGKGLQVFCIVSASYQED